VNEVRTTSRSIVPKRSARWRRRYDATFCGIAVFVTAAALLTSFLSARRAAGVEPLELLRSE